MKTGRKISAICRCISLLLLAGFLLPLFSCADKKPKQPGPRTVPVLVSESVRKDVPVQLMTIGTVEPYATVSITSRVGGQLSAVHFREGQEVTKGDLLFTIDPRPFEAALKQSEANLVRDSAQMENAIQQAKRYAYLVQKGYVSQSDYDQMRANADALQATVSADKAAIESARLNLSYCSIYSPVTGKTGNLQVNQGNLIKENDKTIVTINQIQPLYVSFTLPEHNLPDIKKYSSAGTLRVSAGIPQDEGKPEHGELSFIDNSVDRTTGTIRLKATFANRERRLWPGQFVNVVLDLTVQRDAVVVPSQAVQVGQQGHFVFTVTGDSTVELRQVTPGTSIRGESVILKGLGPGERVVTDGHLRLVPGSKIEVKDSLTGAREKPK